MRARYGEALAEAERAGAKASRDAVLVDPADASAVAGLQSWVRLLARVFEVDPLTCPRCGQVMQIVGFVTQPAVIDKILRHGRERQLTSPFESRAPPAA